MSRITELIHLYKKGEIDFDTLLSVIPTLSWSVRHEDPIDGDWWEGENSVGDVDILWYDAVITDSERRSILAQIP